MAIRSKWQSLPTEAINPATLGIDKLGATDIVELMIGEDRKVLSAVAREKERIALGAELIAEGLRKGGRVFFVGAGTSGRLGVLESAEMPPTFGTDQALVQAIMAGGRPATFPRRVESQRCRPAVWLGPSQQPVDATHRPAGGHAPGA